MTHISVSLLSKPDPEKSRLIWTDLGGHRPETLRNLISALLASILCFAILGWVMVAGWLSATVCAVLGASWTLAMFLGAIALTFQKRREEADDASALGLLLRDDRLWAGILCSFAVFFLYHYY